MRKLLTPARANAKTAKGAELGVEAAILHLAPVDLARPGRSVCPWASHGCAAACLNTSGRGQVRGEVRPDRGSALAVTRRLMRHPIHRARIERTRLFWARRDAFLERLGEEVAALERRAARLSKVAAVRLNGTSDLPWETFRYHDGNFMSAFPGVRFYDYTKSTQRALASRESLWPSNYHLTYSRSEETRIGDVRRILGAGCNVAVVFDALPERWLGFDVVDGLAHDFRFLDPAGVVVGLLAKGRAKRDATGFVVRSARNRR